MTDSDWSTFASVPWTPITDDKSPTNNNNNNNNNNTTTPPTIGFHKKAVPYLPSPLSLQTLDIWIPTSSNPPPPSSTLPPLPGNWLIFIHGGAWRDPLVTSQSFSLTATNILRRLTTHPSATPPIAGLASLNYRLSPYPSHPTDPSPGSNTPPDPSRNAKHPDHISDILSALSYLQRLGGATAPYVLAGHSCGATLAFQAVMDPARWGLSNTPVITKPSVILGVNGIYDLASFIAHPPGGYEGLRGGYEEFTRAAFGDDEGVWKAACPASAGQWGEEWEEGRRVVLTGSKGDRLVPGEQLRGMREFLGRYAGDLGVEEVEVTGGHDEVWLGGEELADVCLRVLGGLR